MPVPWPRSARIRQNSMASMSTCSPPVPGSELPSGRAAEREGEGLAVGARPFGDDVGHDPAVVVGIDVERLGRCPGQVDAVHPHVAGEADVEEVGERLPADRGREVEQGKPGDRAREPGAGPQRPGRGGVPLGDELFGAEAGSLTNLELVHPVPPELAADLGDQRATLADLADELAGRRLAGGGPHDVGGQGPHVPERAVGGLGPVVGLEAAQQAGELGVLHCGDPHGLVVGDPRDRGHVRGRLVWFIVVLLSRVLSLPASVDVGQEHVHCPSARRTQRSPPGSLATC